MEQWISILTGLLGTVVGGFTTFFAQMFIGKSQRSFDLQVKVREDLKSLNQLLSKLQQTLLDYDEESEGIALKERITNLKERHNELMEYYKVYRLYIGDLKAYELFSAVYKYYFMKVTYEKDYEMTYQEYLNAFNSLRYGTGILLNGTRVSLRKIHALSKITKHDRKDILKDYASYSLSLLEIIHFEKSWLESFVFDNMNRDRYYLAKSVMVKRIKPFYDELDKYKIKYMKKVMV